MAFKRKNGVNSVILWIFVIIPLCASVNIDCNGRPFHCINTTHFMICVDIDGSLYTIDDTILPCPESTECYKNNRFECEFPSTIPSSQHESLHATTMPSIPNENWTEMTINTLAPTITSEFSNISNVTESTSIITADTIYTTSSATSETWTDQTLALSKETLHPIVTVSDIKTTTNIYNTEANTSKFTETENPIQHESSQFPILNNSDQTTTVEITRNTITDIDITTKLSTTTLQDTENSIIFVSTESTIVPTTSNEFVTVMDHYLTTDGNHHSVPNTVTIYETFTEDSITDRTINGILNTSHFIGTTEYSTPLIEYITDKITTDIKNNKLISTEASKIIKNVPPLIENMNSTQTNGEVLVTETVNLHTKMLDVFTEPITNAYQTESVNFVTTETINTGTTIKSDLEKTTTLATDAIQDIDKIKKMYVSTQIDIPIQIIQTNVSESSTNDKTSSYSSEQVAHTLNTDISYKDTTPTTQVFSVTNYEKIRTQAPSHLNNYGQATEKTIQAEYTDISTSEIISSIVNAPKNTINIATTQEVVTKSHKITEKDLEVKTETSLTVLNDFKNTISNDENNFSLPQITYESRVTEPSYKNDYFVADRQRTDEPYNTLSNLEIKIVTTTTESSRVSQTDFMPVLYDQHKSNIDLPKNSYVLDKIPDIHTTIAQNLKNFTKEYTTSQNNPLDETAYIDDVSLVTSDARKPIPFEYVKIEKISEESSTLSKTKPVDPKVPLTNAHIESTTDGVFKSNLDYYTNTYDHNSNIFLEPTSESTTAGHITSVTPITVYSTSASSAISSDSHNDGKSIVTDDNGIIEIRTDKSQYFVNKPFSQSDISPKIHFAVESSFTAGPNQLQTQSMLHTDNISETNTDRALENASILSVTSEVPFSTGTFLTTLTTSNLLPNYSASENNERTTRSGLSVSNVAIEERTQVHYMLNLQKNEPTLVFNISSGKPVTGLLEPVTSESSDDDQKNNLTESNSKQFATPDTVNLNDKYLDLRNTVNNVGLSSNMNKDQNSKAENVKPSYSVTTNSESQTAVQNSNNVLTTTSKISNSNENILKTMKADIKVESKNIMNDTFNLNKTYSEPLLKEKKLPPDDFDAQSTQLNHNSTHFTTHIKPKSKNLLRDKTIITIDENSKKLHENVDSTELDDKIQNYTTFEKLVTQSVSPALSSVASIESVDHGYESTNSKTQISFDMVGSTTNVNIITENKVTVNPMNMSKEDNLETHVQSLNKSEFNSQELNQPTIMVESPDNEHEKAPQTVLSNQKRIQNSNEEPSNTNPNSPPKNITFINSFGSPKTVDFNCQDLNRGRYADNEDCRKFYICIGRRTPIVGTCPVNTVFSEIWKQCTKNLDHCVRNNEFRCTSEGRYRDVLMDNIYYICIKHNLNSFYQLKLKCQNGYYLNKTIIKCTPKTNEANEDRSTSVESDCFSKSTDGTSSTTLTEESRKLVKEDFECTEEGIYPDLYDCRRYYICKKSKGRFRRKKKKCDSDEVFHNEKKKCVDADSYEF